MTSDQEPRYRLVDSNGVIRGTLYGKPDGSIAIQETDSGADREVALAPDGTFSAPSVETESVSTEEANINERNLTLGENAETTSETDETVLGGGASYDPVDDPSHNQNQAVVIGTDAFADTGRSVTIGHNAESRFDDTDEGDATVAIGWGALARGHSTTVLGEQSEATGLRATALGKRVTASGSQSLAAGYEAVSEGSDDVALGTGALSQSLRTIAIGRDTIADGADNMVVGRDSTATGGNRSITVGVDVTNPETRSIGIGSNFTVSDREILEIAIDGQKMMRLDINGNMEIAGSLTENATL